MRALQHRLTGPARRAALPVLTGNGRGLRVSVGESVMRVASRGEPQVEKAYLDLLSPGDVVFPRARRPGGRTFSPVPPSVETRAAGQLGIMTRRGGAGRDHDVLE
jgi:hypothetical protein